MALNGRFGSRQGLREKKKAQTKELLQQTALRLFREKGFATTSVDEIAAAADVSRSTFFRYFGSKDAVLFGDYEETGRLFTDLLEARPPDEGPITAYEEALVELTIRRDGDSKRAYAQMFEEVVREDAALESRRFMELNLWTDRVAESFALRRDGTRDATPDDKLAAALCLKATEQVGSRWRAGKDITAVETIRQTFQSLRQMAR